MVESRLTDLGCYASWVQFEVSECRAALQHGGLGARVRWMRCRICLLKYTRLKVLVVENRPNRVRMRLSSSTLASF